MVPKRIFSCIGLRYGAAMVSVDVCFRYSHERYDGSGYSYSVARVKIPLNARIISAVDSFSAMMDKRPYKHPRKLNDAVDEIKQNSGSLYDPKIVTIFFQVLNLPNSKKPKLSREKTGEDC